MEDRVTIQDVVDAGACTDGVLRFVAEHGVIAMPASQLADLVAHNLIYTPLDGFGDAGNDGDGYGNGYGYGSGNGYGEGYGDCYGDGNGRGGGGDGGMR